jgi:hypothetical protein
MKRSTFWTFGFAVVTAWGLSGCGDGGNTGEGVPKDVTGYVPATAPPGSPPANADMTSVGNKPKKAAPAAATPTTPP